MGWAFYEVSGGTDFTPRMASAITIDEIELVDPSPQVVPTQVVANEVAAAEDRQPDGLIFTRRIISNGTISETSDAVIAIRADEQRARNRLVFSLANTDPSDEIRRVRGEDINMRTGPGTQFVVVDILPYNTRVKLLDDSINGWVKLRSLDSGRVGWMHRRFLARPNS